MTPLCSRWPLHSHVSPLETDLKAQIMTRRSRFSLNHPAHTHQVPSMAAQTVYCQDVCVRVHALTSAPQIPASPPRSICCHTLGCRRPLVTTPGTYTQDAAGLHFLQRDLLQIKVKINLLRTAASSFYFFPPLESTLTDYIITSRRSNGLHRCKSITAL